MTRMTLSLETAMSLERILVMNEDGTMNANALQYKGMDRFECRKQLVKDLQEEGILFKIEDHMHSVGHSERSGAVVEPYLSTQWFVKMQPLADEAINLQKETTKFNLFQTVLKRHIYTGWKISVTGVFLVSYGGATAYQLGIIKKRKKYTLDWKHQKILENWERR